MTPSSMAEVKESFIYTERGAYHPKNALRLAQVCQLAYPGCRDINFDYKNEEEFQADMDKKKYQAREWGFESFAYCSSKEKRILALILCNAQDIVIAFRGSIPNNIFNWLTDVQASLIPWNGMGKVHQGFLEALESVWGKIKGAVPYTEQRNIWLTGHSLGAALALLAGARFIKEFKRGLVKGIYAFGQPRVGDKNLRRAINKSYLHNKVYKFANYNDLVTVVPPYMKRLMEYVDVGSIIYFNKEGTLELKEQLSESGAVMNFLSGYFQKLRLTGPGFNHVEQVQDWDSFEGFFSGKFLPNRVDNSNRVDKKVPEAETSDWENFKNFFTRELPVIPIHQRPAAVLQPVLALLARLFIKINPYGVGTHSIAAYIENLRKNKDIYPL